MSKIRNGFVSNSSSSSFVVRTRDIPRCIESLILHPEHILITDYMPENIKQELTDYIEYKKDWTVEVEEDKITFDTIMDNFDYRAIIDYLNIPIYEEDY